eukprot:3619001-Amphidinium_carterae.2
MRQAKRYVTFTVVLAPSHLVGFQSTASPLKVSASTKHLVNTEKRLPEGQHTYQATQSSIFEDEYNEQYMFCNHIILLAHQANKPTNQS